MKKFLFAALAFVISLGAMAQQNADDVIKMNTEKIEFGKIKQGVPVTTYFELKNTSDKPIVIENAWAGCGCTTPEVPKEPIAPNASTKIKVGYNAAAMGPFNKEVYIKLVGIQEPKVVRIVGEVVETVPATEAKAKEQPKAKPAVKKVKAGKK